ncbi:MAG: HDIG domain-containing protein [Bacteroidetes bacterium]|nr:HDIG domain-containing protein [Bacteroidota bacterium]
MLGRKNTFSKQIVFRYLYAATTLLIILSLIPSGQKFKYHYSLGNAWVYDDLYAPFAFSLIKTEEQLNTEKREIKENFIPFYRLDTGISNIAIATYDELVNEAANEINESDIRLISAYKLAGNNIIKSIYKRGLLRLAGEHKNYTDGNIIKLLIGNEVQNGGRPQAIRTFYQLDELKTSIVALTTKYQKLDQTALKNMVLSSLQPNIYYDAQRSEQVLSGSLSAITKLSGVISANQLIISKGAPVTQIEFARLESLRAQYSNLAKEDGYGLHLIGYIILVVFIFIIYIGYIQLFQIELITKNRRLLLLLLNIVFFVLLTRFALITDEVSLFLVPFCIVPIVTLAFFDYKLALITHIVVVLIVGSFINSNEAKFIIIQLVAGFTAILSMNRVQYLSKFFISSLVVLAAYIIANFAFDLTEISSFKELNLKDYLWLVGNFVLTLLAYPLIYAYEKIFGFVSDITLVELGDVNKKLLRRLSVDAPGTFQHSLQVANLSESVINKIGGRALLTRVGALYHDIGKLSNPEYFIENQRYNSNPHQNLTDEESAKMIISHVSEGVKLAKSNNLPPVIIDFIRTHHGESRVEYFYRNYLKKTNQVNIDDSKFRYSGPKPDTREMAVVMICDSIEAATRSLQDKTPEKISSMIDGIINSKLSDHQLDNAPITLQEIFKMKVLLKDLINSMYHVRIEYPEEQKVAE